VSRLVLGWMALWLDKQRDSLAQSVTRSKTADSHLCAAECITAQVAEMLADFRVPVSVIGVSRDRRLTGRSLFRPQHVTGRRVSRVPSGVGVGGSSARQAAE
jgi:hypothetical protein